MANTPNLGLVKPAVTDGYDIAVPNANMDIIDAHLRKNNFTATTVPTVNDDSSQGYHVGSRWLDTLTATEYLCHVDTVGAATWRTVGETFDFENWRYMAGYYYETAFDTPSAGDITQSIKKSSDSSVLAAKVTKFDYPSAGQIQETLTIGSTTITKVTTFGPTITEVVT